MYAIMLGLMSVCVFTEIIIETNNKISFALDVLPFQRLPVLVQRFDAVLLIHSTMFVVHVFDQSRRL